MRPWLTGQRGLDMTAPDAFYTPPPPPAPRRSPARGGGIALLVVGALLLFLAVGLLAAGSVLMWADRTQRDGAGYLTSPTATLSAPDYAIATSNVNVALGDPAWHASSDAFGNVRVTATGASTPIFVGIAPSSGVANFLQGVAYQEPTRFIGGAGGFAYRTHSGGAPSAAPGSQSFWSAQVSGAGTQTLTWHVSSGQWAIVLMNADASRGVNAQVAIGATVPFLFGLALALLIAGAVVIVGGALLVFAGARMLAGGQPAGNSLAPQRWSAAPAGASPPSATSYPLELQGRLDAQPSRWLWLVKWALLIPHYIALAFLGLAAFVLTVIAFFAILFTGRYPRSLFDFNVGVLRWWWRVTFYSYGVLGTDQYPPFSIDEAPSYPATLTVAYPERLSRGLVLVKWWLLAIPQLIIVGILAGGSYAGLIFILVLVVGVMLLFTGRYPADLFNLVMGLNRWVFRVLAYVLLMRDEYPPFRLDMGPSEPAATPAPPAAPPQSMQPRPYGI